MAGKRGNGEGTIYRYRDGYAGQAYVLTTSGARKRVTEYGKTRAEVDEKLTARKLQSQQGVPIPDRTWKLSDFLDYWLEDGVRAKRKPATYERHESIVRLHLKPGLGGITLHGLTVQMVEMHFDRLRASGSSGSELDHIRTTLRAALSYAVRQELLVRNVAQLTEKPVCKAKKSELWGPDETARFFQSARSDPLYPAFVLKVLYGMRRGEVLGLKWSDVNAGQGVLHIRRQLTPKMQLASLKTGSSERDEPLLDTAKDVLRKQWLAQEVLQHEMGARWLGTGEYEGLVFTTRTGRPVSPRNMDRSFDRLIKECGVRKIKLHDLRDTNATTQKKLHVDIRDRQAILGHSDIRTTGGYERVDLQSKRSALEKVENELFPVAELANMGTPSGALQSPLQSSHAFVAYITSLNCGSRGGIRTRDPRLMSPVHYTIQHRLASVRRAMDVAGRAWLIGCVAVNIAVMPSPLLSQEAQANLLLDSEVLSSPEAAPGEVGLVANGLERNGE